MKEFSLPIDPASKLALLQAIVIALIMLIFFAFYLSNKIQND